MKGMYAIILTLFLPLVLWSQKLEGDENLIQPQGSKALIRMQEFRSQRAWPQEDIPIGARVNAIKQERVLRNKLNNNKNMHLAAQPEWTNVGPFNIGGRVKTVAVHPTNADIVYIGAAAGGIWKTTNGGASWRDLFDFENSIAMGSIAIDFNNPDILYAGTGEAVVGGGNIYTGSGMYKSTDAGESWQLIGLSKVGAFSKVFVHPLNSNLVVAGAVNNEQGFYRSTDAGKSWEKLSSKSISDVTYNPNNEMEYFIGANNEGVFYTSDAGNTWQSKNSGIEDLNPIRRVSVQMAPSDPNILYALMEKTNDRHGWIYKTTNKGTSWNLIFSQPGVIFGSNTQGFYDNYLLIDPTTPNVVYAGGIELWVTKTGGTNWLSVQQTTSNGGIVHVDQHHGAFAPSNPQILYIANDGGMYKSVNSGSSWGDINTGLMITQFYAMDIDLTVSQRNYGGTQDNGTLGNPGGQNYGMIFGGDGFDVLVDPSDPNIIIGELYYGQMWRRNLSNGIVEYIGTETAIGDTGAWHSPIIRDPNYPDLMYHGKRELYTSYNRGSSWIRLTSDGRGGKFSCIDASPITPLNIIAGNSMGEVVVSDDNGLSFREVHQNGLITRFVTDVKFAIHDQNIAYATFSGYGNPHVFKTTNLGQSWVNISQNLPDVPVNCMAVHPFNKDIIFVGTDIGVYASFDDGNNWFPYGKNFPKTPVLDIKFHTNNQIQAELKIRAATHGRSIFEASVPDEGITEAEITKPAGGEKLISTSGTIISWFGFGAPVKVEFSKDDGMNWQTVAENLVGNYMVWNVPNYESYLCRIKITTMDGSLSRLSNTFTISKKQKGDLIQQSIFNHAPYGIAYDGEKYLYTTSFYENKIYVLNAEDLSLTRTFDLPNGQYYTGIAIDKINKNIYIHKMTGEGGGGGIILKYDFQGNYIGQKTSPAKRYPTGLAYLNGYLYVNDRDGDRLIHQFDYEKGVIISSVSNPYQKELGPRGLCSTPDNTLYQICTEFPNSGALNEALVLEMTINSNSAQEKQSMPLRNATGLLNGRGVEIDPSNYDIWASTFSGDIVKIAGFNTVVSVENNISVENLFENLNVYPNPTEGISNIAFIPSITGEVSIEVNDLLGNLILSQSAFVFENNPFEMLLDLSDESTGVYQVSVFYQGKLININRLIKN